MKIRAYLESFTRKAYAAHEPAGEQVELLDCSLGVNSFGVSEKVLEAVKEYDWSCVWSCPDPSYKDLKAKIIEFWSDHADLKMSQIQIGHGSMEVLERVNRIFLDTDSRVLGYAPQFTGYVADIGACGAQYIPVILRPEENFKFFVERLIGNVSSECGLIFIDNPNNPTGQMISLSDIEAVVKEARNKDVAVIVDEAYGDYFEPKHSAVNLLNKYHNLIVTRTFGKGLGLCSLKIGYGILSMELCNYFNKVSPPFRATTISSYLAGIALSDQDFIASCRQRVKIEKAKLIKGLRERGYFIGDTYGYCPIFLAGHDNKDIDLRRELLSNGILTVPGPDFESLGKNSVRINCPASAEELLQRLD
jgi:histidinol-phosphate aminotransferase